MGPAERSMPYRAQRLFIYLAPRAARPANLLCYSYCYSYGGRDRNVGPAISIRPGCELGTTAPPQASLR